VTHIALVTTRAFKVGAVQDVGPRPTAGEARLPRRGASLALPNDTPRRISRSSQRAPPKLAPFKICYRLTRLLNCRMKHRARPVHRAAIPQHVTLRVFSRSLRSQFVFPTVRGAIDSAHRRNRGRFQIVHFSVQSNHVHLLVEAQSHRALVEGIRGFNVSLARRINRLLFRSGRLLAERWHGHPLTTPRAVRRALVYVLANARKHGEAFGALDPLSSAPYFGGFCEFPDGARADLDSRSSTPGMNAERNGVGGTRGNERADRDARR
jgi:REP element-mobilizing transposase RayT